MLSSSFSFYTSLSSYSLIFSFIRDSSSSSVLHVSSSFPISSSASYSYWIINFLLLPLFFPFSVSSSAFYSYRIIPFLFRLLFFLILSLFLSYIPSPLPYPFPSISRSAQFCVRLLKRLWHEVLTAVTMKTAVFWDVTPCSPVKLLLTF
jgi:hypothetical protein